MVSFPTWISDFDYHSPVLLDLFICSDPSICSTVAFPPLANSNHVIVSVYIDFPSILKEDPPEKRTHFFTAQLLVILVVIWVVFVVIYKIFHWKISLNLVLLLLMLNFLNGFRLELMYVSHITNIRSSLISMVSSCLCCCCSS